MAEISAGPLSSGDKHTPIPTSPSVLWRSVRQRCLPVVVLGAALTVLICLWRDQLGGGIPALAEGVRSSVTCPLPAQITDLKVRPYQWVKAGQPLLTLQPVDPRANLDLLQSELQLARLKLEPSLAEQNAMDFERLRIESMRLQQEIAVAEVNLQRAENALQRHARLRTDHLVSEATYDFSLKERDMYQAEIREKRKAAAAIDGRLAQLHLLGDPQAAASNTCPQPWLPRLEDKLLAAQTNWHPITLRAPISGMVQLVNRQAGEFAPENDPLLTIVAEKADRIVGYMRQPYVVDPKVGMPVEVVTRTFPRQKFASHICQIGAQVEPITNALAFVRPGLLVDMGLPIVVEVPQAFPIRPGETVDLLFLLSPAPKAAGATRVALHPSPAR